MRKGEFYKLYVLKIFSILLSAHKMYTLYNEEWHIICTLKKEKQSTIGVQTTCAYNKVN